MIRHLLILTLAVLCVSSWNERDQSRVAYHLRASGSRRLVDGQAVDNHPRNVHLGRLGAQRMDADGDGDEPTETTTGAAEEETTPAHTQNTTPTWESTTPTLEESTVADGDAESPDDPDDPEEETGEETTTGAPEEQETTTGAEVEGETTRGAPEGSTPEVTTEASNNSVTTPEDSSENRDTTVAEETTTGATEEKETTPAAEEETTTGAVVQEETTTGAAVQEATTTGAAVQEETTTGAVEPETTVAVKETFLRNARDSEESSSFVFVRAIDVEEDPRPDDLHPNCDILSKFRFYRSLDDRQDDANEFFGALFVLDTDKIEGSPRYYVVRYVRDEDENEEDHSGATLPNSKFQVFRHESQSKYQVLDVIGLQRGYYEFQICAATSSYTPSMVVDKWERQAKIYDVETAKFRQKRNDALVGAGEKPPTSGFQEGVHLRGAMQLSEQDIEEEREYLKAMGGERLTISSPFFGPYGDDNDDEDEDDD